MSDQKKLYKLWSNLISYVVLFQFPIYDTKN